ncbi:MAG TPA: Clp protease N-terminal domain-containing protein [Bryobacteraceae bacterium]|jgi:hypothetical protein|nr:Clp protease N-terminal domain-containing protein [Bryobacteraceae bacterium]
MFERYTPEARRSIFFARFDAGRFGSPYMETEHLLLGLLREDRSFRNTLAPGVPEQIVKRIEERAPQPALPAGTSVDLPLSESLRRALTYAGEESEALQATSIDCSHLLLGLLHLETSTAAVVLRELGIDYTSYREALTAIPELSMPPATAPPNISGPLRQAAADLTVVVNTVRNLAEKPAQRLKRAGWTRKEAVGHLIDWAAAHQQLFARALTEPKVNANGYPDETWLSAQHYDRLPWWSLVDLAISLNRLIVHIIANIPDEKLDTPCRIGIAEPIPLQELVRRYVAHCEDILAQLLMRG